MHIPQIEKKTYIQKIVTLVTEEKSNIIVAGDFNTDEPDVLKTDMKFITKSFLDKNIHTSYHGIHCNLTGKQENTTTPYKSLDRIYVKGFDSENLRVGTLFNKTDYKLEFNKPLIESCGPPLIDGRGPPLIDGRGPPLIDGRGPPYCIKSDSTDSTIVYDEKNLPSHHTIAYDEKNWPSDHAIVITTLKFSKTNMIGGAYYENKNKYFQLKNILVSK